MAGTKADAKAETGSGGGGSFSEQGLVEKLNKLNNSAASIQTLSHWCVFHRKRSKRVVDTWKKQFNDATKDKKVSFLYLSNDILQNSKRKGGEFINEFWRVLPGSLKDVYENGGEDGKKVVARLIGIWDERKVFGTRIENLKVDIFGDNPPTLDNKDNSSNPSSNSKAARKDSSTITKKLIVGGMPEKIVTAYQSVLDQHFDEDTALNKCKTTASLLEKMDKDVDHACTQGTQQASSLISDLQEQEVTLKRCIDQLESVDVSRVTLINQLKEALSEQEAKSELLRNQLQVARAEAEHAIQLRQRLASLPVTTVPGSSSSPLVIALSSEQTTTTMQNSAIRPISPQFQTLHPATSTPAMATGDEPKKTAAAMADKLASLSSREQVLSSIFSSLAAEAASINGGSPSGELSDGPPGFQTQKRPRFENPLQSGDMGAAPFFGQVPQAQQQIGAVPTSLGGTLPLPLTQANQAPGSFAPPPPPLPPVMPPLLQQFGQNTGGMFGMAPFGMMAGSIPLPPPMSNTMQAGFLIPNGPPPPPPLPPAQNQSQSQQQQSSQAPQQPPTSTVFFPTSGLGFFPPVPVQQSPSAQRQ